MGATLIFLLLMAFIYTAYRLRESLLGEDNNEKETSIEEDERSE